MVELNWSASTEEELLKIVDSINEELQTRRTVKLEEAKTKAVIAIRELVAICKELHIYHLGYIECECEECERDIDFDILSDEILHDVAEVLERGR